MNMYFDKPILILDDEEKWTERVKEILYQQGYRVIDTKNVIGKFSDLLKKYELAIVDIKMPRFDGFQIKDFFKLKSPVTKILLISQYEDFGIDLLDKAKGADGWFRKQNLDDNEVSFIMLVSDLLEPHKKDIHHNNESKVASGININIDIANEVGIRTADQIELSRLLEDLREEINKGKINNSRDTSLDVDHLGLELSKKKKDKKYILGTLEKIKIGAGHIFKVAEYIDKISDIVNRAIS